MIHGKIKKELLNKYKNDLFFEISEDLNVISIEKFIKILQEESKIYYTLVDALKLLDYIREYRKIVSKNIATSFQFNEIIQHLILILRYNTLLKRKNLLLKELDVAEYYKISRNKTTITDLLKKLNESLINNNKKLKFLEEDYLQRKNQVDQIKTKIEEFNIKIQELTNQKKQYFNQINRITRKMAEDTQGTKNESSSTGEDSRNHLTNAEKIKNFQNKAKDIQFEMTKIKSKKNQTQLKLEELNPIFETYRTDYEKVLEIINNEEKRINELHSELKKEIRDNENIIIEDLDLINLKSLKPLQVIKEDIEKVDIELEQIIIPKEFYNLQNADDLSIIIQQLKELEDTIKNHESELTITVNEKETIKCFEQFTKLENAINEIESLTNKFLSEIHLMTQFRFILNDANKRFFIKIKFIRSDKKQVNFDELTTPEKIFFIIVFYISIKLHTKSENIIFSNVSLLSKYNKAGSTYRTIRKILPLFERDDILSGFNLVFIISNLELKKEIKNLKIKTLQES
ncbi:MAG: hypothetical protein KAW51_02510 [Candidatus Lokiarchaeota archaeon]|nr:hypothetical protein [Candidatus Lokiarchaeota archaeon]